MVMDAVRHIFIWMQSVLAELNTHSLGGVNMLDLFIGFLITSILVTVFWKGAQG